jgi:hypothetical protein
MTYDTSGQQLGSSIARGRFFARQVDGSETRVRFELSAYRRDASRPADKAESCS